MTDVHGTCDDRFGPVRDAFAANFDSGLEVGASVAIALDGELVVDLWAGDWEQDTLVNVWSSTKTMTALCALILADRGELDVDAPVARYWPGFEANGKEGVLVRHLLSHTAGLPGWTAEPMAPEDLYDWEKATAVLARQAPMWAPGTAIGYHAATQGYLVGEVVRRIDGRSLGTFFRDEVAQPLGADFHIGTPPACDPRITAVVPPPEALSGDGATDLAKEAWANPALDASQANTEGWRRAEIPAANGHGNARSMATVQRVVSCGGEVDGVRLLSPASIDLIFREQAYDADLMLGVKLRHGIGYGLTSPDLPVSPNERACFWGGWGGSLVVNDLDLGMTFAYAMSRMGEGTTGDARGGSILLAAYGALA